MREILGDLEREPLAELSRQRCIGRLVVLGSTACAAVLPHVGVDLLLGLAFWRPVGRRCGRGHED
jgi:hypothetical protein